MKKNKIVMLGLLAAALAFATGLAGCDLDSGNGAVLPEGIEDDLFGAWGPPSDPSWRYIFSAGSYSVRQTIPEDNPDAGADISYTITISSWQAVVNTDESTREEYPAGYRVIGTMTAVGTWYLENRPDDYWIGRPTGGIWLLSSDKTKLIRSDWPEDYSIYYTRRTD